ncbi:hypothetical protein ABZY42_21110 [Streptomyces sp. NPDC006622]|uniref:hypothetical protein n=1 Tax=Streptomyces sp. NPDC006622 TaxID=3155459 RepID=UPI0033BC123D
MSGSVARRASSYPARIGAPGVVVSGAYQRADVERPLVRGALADTGGGVGRHDVLLAAEAPDGHRDALASRYPLYAGHPAPSVQLDPVLGDQGDEPGRGSGTRPCGGGPSDGPDTHPVPAAGAVSASVVRNPSPVPVSATETHVITPATSKAASAAEEDPMRISRPAPEPACWRRRSRAA